jgi:HK97 family phage portal protein
MYDSFNYDYAALYRMQPNVRVCVDFLARNIAQLGLHTFRRVSDTDRERLTDHPLAQLLSMPLPAKFKITRYRFVESMVSDLGIYFDYFAMKIRKDGVLKGLLRVPPPFMTVKGNPLTITGYEINIGGWPIAEFPPEEVVHIHGYNPEDPKTGLPPLETLRRVLAEEHAAGQYREEFWQNSARMAGFVERPLEAPDWSVTARDRWLAEFNELFSGQGSGGKTVALEEGMKWVQAAYNPQESEYLAGRKLAREECARSYHIPLPFAGILDNATFSNITEQHKNLYQDCLGPTLTQIEQDIELQVLPDFDDSAGIYVEFNIQEKLQGSFQEQTQSLQSAIGRPWMTANEGRARMNLPRLDSGDADELVVPLNVLVGGQANPRDSLPKLRRGTKGLSSHFPELRERHRQKWTEVLTRYYRRQEAAIVSRVPKNRKEDIGGVWWDSERWDSELTVDLFALNNLTAMTWAGLMAAELGVEISEERMQAWLLEHSQVQAANINAQTQEELTNALNQPDALEAVKNVFVLAVTVWAVRQAVSAVTAASNFGAHEAANAGGLRRKRWHVNSSNPRPSHAAINGQTVGIRDKFSNGLKWPGDPNGSADEVAGCQCTVEFFGED